MSYRKLPKIAWVNWGLISLFYAYQYILRVIPNILMPEIMEKFQVDANLFGQFAGLYYLGYAGAHIPLGILLDRKGPKYIVPICIMFIVIGTLPLIFAEKWAYPCIGRILIGIGSSAAILGAFKIIRMHFPENQFTRMLGISVTIGLLGAIYGGEPVHYLLETFGGEKVIACISLMGAVLALLIFVFTPHYQGTGGFSSASIFKDVKAVLTNYKVIIVCLLAGLMVGPLEGFADVWGTEFLKAVYNLDQTTASTLPSLMFLGMCFGSPFLTYLADKTQAYFMWIIIAAFTMGSVFLLLIFGVGSPATITILFCFVGVMCSYQIIAIYKASTFVPENLAGLTTACANMIIMTFGYMFHSSIGFLMQLPYTGITEHPSYTALDFARGIGIIPICLFAAGIGFSILMVKSRSTKTSRL
jgi:predicted MFS family arabinose efflux permease